MKIRKAILLMAIILVVTPSIVQAQEIFDAIRDGDLAKVKELIEKDPELLKGKNTNLSTPLHVAVDVDNEPITRYLIEKGADPNAANRSKNTPLHYVKSTDITKLLIERGADINAQNSSFVTPLFQAGRGGRFGIVKLLVENGVDINWERPGLPATALGFVLWGKQNEIADYLMDQGAAIQNAGTQGGMGDLISALKAGNVKYLVKSLQQGLDPLFLGETRNSLLHYAVEGDSIEMINRLIELKLPVDTKNIFGWTPLHIAAHYGKKQSAAVLIQKGVDLNVKTGDGKTAYNLAMESKNTELAEFLAIKGADKRDPTFPDIRGEYLGQPKPGKTAEVFAPGIVGAQYQFHSAVAFSPDGNEAYWSEWGSGISGSRRINGKWTIPAKYSEGDVPFISPDGRKFYFVAYSQVQGESKEIIYVREEAESGWSDPKELPDTINSMPGIHWQVSVDRKGTLYFGAWGESGYRVFCAEYQKGEYGIPRVIDRLKDVDAHSPYIAPDGSYLIVSGQWKDRNLKIMFKKKKGSWTRRIDLSDYTGDYASCPIVTHDGKYLFFFRYVDGKNVAYWMDASFIEGLRKEALKDDE
jgi:ankyrin repeat protein